MKVRVVIAKLLRTTLTTSLMLMAVGVATVAGPLQDMDAAVAAFQRGDYAAAARINHRLADLGFAPAQTVLGLAYHYGRGVRQNDPEAVKWFRKAADQGYAEAEFYLARAYEYGMGVRQNYTEAMKWFREAADQGYANAQNDIGLAYLNGQGVPQNHAEAVKWFRKSAEQGNASGQWMLGMAYQGGHGAPQNYVLAYMWSNLAVGRTTTAEDHDMIFKWRDSMATAMSPAQITYAQVLSQKCLESNYKDCGPSTVTMGVALKDKGSGTLTVPVEINDTMTLNFIIDSGASDVVVPADVFSTLKRTGTIKETDFTGLQTYVLADGKELQSQTFMIRTLRVGDLLVKNVAASVAPLEGSLLLGQSFLARFKLWSIDNEKKKLFLEPL
jgi:clan AA aspartic protease (TIGR02281 family)